MHREIRLKICGITRAQDARVAVEAGAEFLGFILYSKSPRFLPLERFRELAPELPTGSTRVAVMVEPTVSELAAAANEGFDRFQIHAGATFPPATIRAWSEQVGADRLWLAPKLPPGVDVPAEWLGLAGTFLLDTFHAEGFGGTGKTGDWEKFARHQAKYPQKTWVLAGGLTPENIAAAISNSGARFVDVNSGVESAPGVKDHGKLRALKAALGRT